MVSGSYPTRVEFIEGLGGREGRGREGEGAQQSSYFALIKALCRAYLGSLPLPSLPPSPMGYIATIWLLHQGNKYSNFSGDGGLGVGCDWVSRGGLLVFLA